VRHKARSKTTWCPVHGASEGVICKGCRDRDVEATVKKRKKQKTLDEDVEVIKQIFADTDFEALKKIFEPVVPIEHAKDGLLCLRFSGGTRLSFLCGTQGQLNVVAIQHGPDTPELRLPED